MKHSVPSAFHAATCESHATCMRHDKRFVQHAACDSARVFLFIRCDSIRTPEAAQVTAGFNVRPKMCLLRGRERWVIVLRLRLDRLQLRGATGRVRGLNGARTSAVLVASGAAVLAAQTEPLFEIASVTVRAHLVLPRAGGASSIPCLFRSACRKAFRRIHPHGHRGRLALPAVAVFLRAPPGALVAIVRSRSSLPFPWFPPAAVYLRVSLRAHHRVSTASDAAA